MAVKCFQVQAKDGLRRAALRGMTNSLFVTTTTIVISMVTVNPNTYFHSKFYWWRVDHSSWYNSEELQKNYKNYLLWVFIKSEMQLWKEKSNTKRISKKVEQ